MARQVKRTPNEAAAADAVPAMPAELELIEALRQYKAAKEMYRAAYETNDRARQRMVAALAAAGINDISSVPRA